MGNSVVKNSLPADFIDVLSNRGIYWSEYTEEKFDQDMKTINSILEEDELSND